MLKKVIHSILQLCIEVAMDNINYEEILKKYWGYDTFRGMQKEAIKAVVEEKKDVFFLAPTSLR